MKIELHATTVQPRGIPVRLTPTNRLWKCLVGILMAYLFQGAGEVRAQTSQGSYEVKLAWNANPGTDVTGYRIHYGTTSGTYTASILVGNVTQGTIPGLAEGATYHFAVTALNAAGLESGFSNEVNFKPGLHTSRIRAAADGATVLSLRGLIGRQYDIEASVDLKAWTLIETVTMPNGGSLEFSDPDAGSYPRRFYRTRQRP
jgi:hypothetical protein